MLLTAKACSKRLNVFIVFNLLNNATFVLSREVGVNKKHETRNKKKETRNMKHDSRNKQEETRNTKQQTKDKENDKEKDKNKRKQTDTGSGRFLGGAFTRRHVKTLRYVWHVFGDLDLL